METDNGPENIISDSLRHTSLLGTFPPVIQQPHQQKMFDHSAGDIDPKLQERIEECKRQNSTLPITKEIMKCKILERRAQLGLGDINITFEEQKTFTLTAEEEEKRQRRRDQNKKAAARCRDRRRQRDKILSQEVGQELKKNAILRESLKKLKEERDDLVSQLIDHGRTCPILAPIRQISAYNNNIKSSPKRDNDFYHKNNDNGFCETFITAESIPTSVSRLLPVTKVENSEASTLSPISYDKPCMTLQSPVGVTLTKADNHSYVSSNALTLVGTSEEQDFPLDFISFPFPSPSSSPSPFVPSSTFPFPSSSFPTPPSSTLPPSPPNLFPSPPAHNIFPPLLPPPAHQPVLLSSDPLSSSPLETPTHPPLPIPTRFPHLSPVSPETPSFSPSSLFSASPTLSFSSSHSFSPSPSSFSSTSSQASDCALRSIFDPGYSNNQTSYSRTDGNLLDTATFIPNTDLYNPNVHALVNKTGKTNLHTPLITSQIEGASLLATERLKTDTHPDTQRPDSGDNCDHSLQFPLQLSQEHFGNIFIDVSEEHVSNQNELDLQTYL